MDARALLLACGLAACQLSVDPGVTAYRCEPGDACPPGTGCVDGICRADAPVRDAGAADAAPPSTAYATAVLADRPVLYLPLDDLGEIAEDRSGHRRHGVYLGGVARAPTGAFTGSGGAARFDGLDDRVAVPDDPALRLVGDFSIELWIRVIEPVHTYPGVVHKGGGEAGFIVYYRTDSGELVLKRANIDNLTTVSAVATDEYRHYVVTYEQDAATLRWYVDGRLEAMYDGITYPLNVDATELSIGRGDDYGRQLIDEVALYDRALTPERVRAHRDAAGP